MAIKYSCCMLCPGSETEHHPESCPYGLATAARFRLNFEDRYFQSGLGPLAHHSSELGEVDGRDSLHCRTCAKLWSGGMLAGELEAHGWTKRAQIHEHAFTVWTPYGYDCACGTNRAMHEQGIEEQPERIWPAHRKDALEAQEQPERHDVDLDAHLGRATRFAKAELEKQIAAMDTEDHVFKRYAGQHGGEPITFPKVDRISFEKQLAIDAMTDDEVRKAFAAMTGYPVPTPRQLAEEKVRVLLECDAATKALAFTMLRAEGMDSDRAKLILRDAKWLLP